MKKIVIIASLSLFIFSCEREYRYNSKPLELNSLRLDDDSEYHYNGDWGTENDVYSDYFVIERDSSLTKPLLYLVEVNEDNAGWHGTNVGGSSELKTKIVLPVDYVIPTFED